VFQKPAVTTQWSQVRTLAPDGIATFGPSPVMTPSRATSVPFSMNAASGEETIRAPRTAMVPVEGRARGCGSRRGQRKRRYAAIPKRRSTPRPTGARRRLERAGWVGSAGMRTGRECSGESARRMHGPLPTQPRPSPGRGLGPAPRPGAFGDVRCRRHLPGWRRLLGAEPELGHLMYAHGRQTHTVYAPQVTRTAFACALRDSEVAIGRPLFALLLHREEGTTVRVCPPRKRGEDEEQVHRKAVHQGTFAPLT